MFILKTINRILVTISLAGMSLTPFTAAAEDNSPAKGSTCIIEKTISMTVLTIAEGTNVIAPEGYSVTMTVNGIETPIKAGNYFGDIVLSVTKDILVEYNGSSNKLRSAIVVENGKYVAEKSVSAAMFGGPVTDTSADDVKITSAGENFNGIIVTGDSKYSINNPDIKLTGNGGNDFAGIGTAIMTDGNADVTVNKASIINQGVIRNAILVRGNSTIHVNDSHIETYNGIMPEKTVGMMSVPWVLGLTGNVRSTNIIGNGTAFYNNTYLKSQAWGVLSTDDTKKVRLTATKCTIETVESGYGSYSIGDCINTFSGCTFKVNDYALIMANETASGIFTDKSTVNSGRFGVMIHAGNYGNLTIDKGTVFNTKKAVIQVKTAYPTIVVDGAKLNSENGIILQAVINDDPDMSGDMFGGGMPGAASSGPGGTGGNMPGSPGNGGGSPGSLPGGMSGGATGVPGGPGGGMTAMANADTGNEIKATFKNMTLSGDIINSMTSKGDMIISFEKAAITGAITTATQSPAGEKPSKEKYYLIGEIKNTYCVTEDKYGIKVSLDKNSRWIVDKTSYLTGLTIDDGASLTAPKGSRINMTVDGVAKKIKPGSYEGRIILTVTKG